MNKPLFFAALRQLVEADGTANGTVNHFNQLGPDAALVRIEHEAHPISGDALVDWYTVLCFQSYVPSIMAHREHALDDWELIEDLVAEAERRASE